MKIWVIFSSCDKILWIMLTNSRSHSVYSRVCMEVNSSLEAIKEWRCRSRRIQINYLLVIVQDHFKTWSKETACWLRIGHEASLGGGEGVAWQYKYACEVACHVSVARRLVTFIKIVKDGLICKDIWKMVGKMVSKDSQTIEVTVIHLTLSFANNRENFKMRLILSLWTVSTGNSGTRRES